MIHIRPLLPMALMLALMPHMAQAQAAYSPPSLIRPGTATGQTARWDNALKKWVPTTGMTVDNASNLVTTGHITAAGQLLSPYVLPAGSASTLGGFRVGTGLSVDASGILSAASPYTLPAATTTTLGGIIAGAGLTVTPGGTLSTVNNGTVTSVGLTMPGVLFNSVAAGSPVTGAGTLAPTLLTQAANTVLAGPGSGTAATPGFRGLVSADLPQSPVFSGVVTTASGLVVNYPAGTGPGIEGLTINTGGVRVAYLNSAGSFGGNGFNINYLNDTGGANFSGNLTNSAGTISGPFIFAGGYQNGFAMGSTADYPARTPLGLKLAPGQTADASQVLSATGAVLQSISAAGVEQAAGYKTSDGSTGLTVTVPLAPLTTGGSSGSETFKNGLLTAYTPPT